MSQAIIEPIVCETVIDLPPEESFRFFTERFGDWWPRDYTFSRNLLSGMYLGQAMGAWSALSGLRRSRRRSAAVFRS